MLVNNIREKGTGQADEGDPFVPDGKLIAQPENEQTQQRTIGEPCCLEYCAHHAFVVDLIEDNNGAEDD